MIETTLIVPKTLEECERITDCRKCNYYSSLITTSQFSFYKCKQRELMKMNNTESTKKLEDFPLVTTSPVKITPLSPLPHTIFVPRLFKDGNMWCALYGKDMMEGIVGFGRSPDKAIKRFNNAFYEDIMNNEIVEKPSNIIPKNIKDVADVTGLFKRKISVQKKH